MCKKCSKLSGVLVLIAGVLLLLQDVNVWNFWGLSWSTVAFLLAGFFMLAMGSCSMCGTCQMPEKKGKK